MYQSNEWQFWAIGAVLVVALVATAAMQSLVPLVVCFVGVAVVGAVDESRSKKRIRSSKVCPRCAERVKAAAEVCRFCGHEFGKGDGSGPRGG